jgi:hypothetical protein
MAPRSGLFVGPKLIFSTEHVNAYAPPGFPSVRASNSFALEVGVEAGVRFQFSHFELTLVMPGMSLGYGWNQSGLASDPWDANFSSSGFAYDLDLNFVRLGVSF